MASMIFFSLSLIFDLGVIDPFFWPHRMRTPPTPIYFKCNRGTQTNWARFNGGFEWKTAHSMSGKNLVKCWSRNTKQPTERGAVTCRDRAQGKSVWSGKITEAISKAWISPHSRCDDPLLGISWLGTGNGHPLGRVVEKQTTHKLSQEAGTWHLTYCPNYLNVSIYSTWIADCLFIMPY